MKEGPRSHGLSASRPFTTAGPLDDEPDGADRATCPMCHAPAPVTRSAIEAGGDWRCVRCGQHWDARRLAATGTYAAWAADFDRADRRGTEPSQGVALDDHSRLGAVTFATSYPEEHR